MLPKRCGWRRLHRLALANPDLGPGGGIQFFIPDFDKVLEPVRTIELFR